MSGTPGKTGGLPRAPRTAVWNSRDGGVGPSSHSRARVLSPAVCQAPAAHRAVGGARAGPWLCPHRLVAEEVSEVTGSLFLCLSWDNLAELFNLPEAS